MLKGIAISALMIFSGEILATQTTGKISELATHGSGVNEIVTFNIDMSESVCAYKGFYVMPSADRPAAASIILAGRA
ncbi:MAG: hypothetical protein K0U59_00715 [Gammaproteobacteria bacterium]|nr:hypothetical protein [Gammaproteobacteria bacterium]